MRTFNAEQLPERTKNMFQSQKRWSEKNWKDTLKVHSSRDIEKLLQRINVYDVWKNTLRKHGRPSQELLPEIWMDAYMSIHFACMGLYKQANICSRAQLESALRLSYL